MLGLMQSTKPSAHTHIITVCVYIRVIIMCNTYNFVHRKYIESKTTSLKSGARSASLFHAGSCLAYN